MEMIDDDLPKRPANFSALTPISFLLRTADVYPDRVAVRYAGQSTTYHDFADRCRRLAASLVAFGVERGDVVSIIAPNTPAHLEAHFGVPMAGAVLNSINTRLDAATVAFMLDHARSRLLIVDDEFAPLARAACALQSQPVPVVHISDAAVIADPVGLTDYEDFIASGASDFCPIMPADEWDAIALNYTSGTTADPKGVVYHHRGAYLGALGNSLAWQLAGPSRYLWTLPMFHCNGWCFTWAVTAFAGTHICMRRLEPTRIAQTIAEERVTHFSGAPIVLSMLADLPDALRSLIPSGVKVMTAGAPPPASMISRIEEMGVLITHTYGLTETYGPCAVCEEQPAWGGLQPEERAAMKARQGVRFLLQDGMEICDSATMQPVPNDGRTLGEVVFRGNMVMKGYARNPEANKLVFTETWLRSGDLGVRHEDGYVEIKDRAKDIIISGGENISTIEVESALYRHPAVQEAAVVARPDERWGEVPCAFVSLRPETTASETELIEFVRKHLAGFKVPKFIIFGDLPKTATGKIQKFALRDRVKRICNES